MKTSFRTLSGEGPHEIEIAEEFIICVDFPFAEIHTAFDTTSLEIDVTQAGSLARGVINPELSVLIFKAKKSGETEIRVTTPSGENLYRLFVVENKMEIAERSSCVEHIILHIELINGQSLDQSAGAVWHVRKQDLLSIPSSKLQELLDSLKQATTYTECMHKVCDGINRWAT